MSETVYVVEYLGKNLGVYTDANKVEDIKIAFQDDNLKVTQSLLNPVVYPSIRTKVWQAVVDFYTGNVREEETETLVLDLDKMYNSKISDFRLSLPTVIQIYSYISQEQATASVVALYKQWLLRIKGWLDNVSSGNEEKEGSTGTGNCLEHKQPDGTELASNPKV